MNILIFGDSIAWGAFDTQAGGWADRLKALTFQDYKDTDFYNMSINGDTTRGLLKRLELDIQLRKSNMVIIALGTNDSLFDEDSEDHLVPFVEFQENLKKIHDIAKTQNQILVFVGGIPADESKTTPLPWQKNLFSKNEDISKYDSEIERFAKERDLHFIPMLDVLDMKIRSTDGLHPDAQGHQMMFERIRDFLVDKNLIEL